jgi:hypothetical protein
MNAEINSSLESIARRLDEAALTYANVVPHVGALLKTIKPTTRKDTLNRVADAIPQFPVVLAWFQQQMASNNNKFPAYAVEDLFGDAFWGWKSRHELDEDPKWEELSRDPYLRTAIEAVVRNAPKAQVAGQDTRDYLQMQTDALRLTELLKKLAGGDGDERSRKDAIKYCEKIISALD